jgi:hypothetical protein
LKPQNKFIHITIGSSSSLCCGFYFLENLKQMLDGLYTDIWNITLTTTQYYFNLSCNGWEILTNQIQINKILTSFVEFKKNKTESVKICHPLTLNAEIVTTEVKSIMYTNQNVGGMPNIQFIDMQDKSLNLQTAIF